MEDKGQEDGERDGRARSGFDPGAGMRAFAAVQAEGLRAATELLERVLDPVREPLAEPVASTSHEYRELVDAWAELLQRIAASLASSAGPDAHTVPLDSEEASTPLRMTLGRDERECRAEVWLHNGGSAELGPLALSCSPLTAPDGLALEGARVGFEPANVERVPPRSNRAIRVSVEVDGAAEPGVYRGAIQAQGVPRLWLPLQVTVPEPDDPC